MGCGGGRDKEEAWEGIGTKGQQYSGGSWRNEDPRPGLKARSRSRQDQRRGSGLRTHMAEPELKQRGSRESVAKAASQEKMEGR